MLVINQRALRILGVPADKDCPSSPPSNTLLGFAVAVLKTLLSALSELETVSSRSMLEVVIALLRSFLEVVVTLLGASDWLVVANSSLRVIAGTVTDGSESDEGVIEAKAMDGTERVGIKDACSVAVGTSDRAGAGGPEIVSVCSAVAICSFPGSGASALLPMAGGCDELIYPSLLLPPHIPPGQQPDRPR